MIGMITSRPCMGLALAAVVATSCSSPAEPSIPLPAGDPTVVVAMDEYRFDYDPEVPAGRVVFRFDNVGQLPHRVTMLPLPEDFPPIEEQLRSAERRVITPFAGIPDRPPGASETFAVDLLPGVRYALICFVEDPDGQSHAQKGMASEFRAAGEVAIDMTTSTSTGG